MGEGPVWGSRAAAMVILSNDRYGPVATRNASLHMRMRTSVSWSVRARSGPSPAPDAAELPPDHVLASAERRPPQRRYPRLACYAVLLCRLAPLSPPNSRKFLQRTYKNKGLDAPALLQKRSRKPLRVQALPGFESLSLRHISLKSFNIFQIREIYYRSSDSFHAVDLGCPQEFEAHMIAGTWITRGCCMATRG